MNIIVIETIIIESDFTHQDKIETLKRSESEMNNKEQQKLSSYYKTIAEIIYNFNEVLLFGPTHAKEELFNFLKNHHKYDKIKIEVNTTDKMREEEQHHFVRDYYKKFEFKKIWKS